MSVLPMVASVGSPAGPLAGRLPTQNRSVLIAAGVVLSCVLVGAGVLLGTRLEDPGPRATGATLTAGAPAQSPAAASPAASARSTISDPAHSAPPLLFTANVNDLPRVPVRRPPVWAPPPARPAVPPPATAPQSTAASPADTATEAPDPEPPHKATPAPTADPSPPQPAASAEPTPAPAPPPAPASTDPLIREMQKAVDDQAHH